MPNISALAAAFSRSLAQTATTEPTATATIPPTAIPPTAIPPTQPPAATEAPTAEPTSAPFKRPQIGVANYRVNGGQIIYGQDFTLVVKLENAGQIEARNVQAIFTSPNLVPVKNGGTDILTSIGSGNRAEVSQQMRLIEPVYTSTITLEVSVSYYDIAGTAYSDKFVLAVPVVASGGSSSGGTATPTGVKSSQLVITSYKTSVDPLQPGMQFTLDVTVQNMGNAPAQRVVMILGGGSTGGTDSGTPQAGGVTGGSGEFTNFAPIGASNVQSLGNLAPGANLQASQNLIVNVSTNPGAYPMPITFSYLDEKGNVVNDQQVITLLVFNLPNVDINFYTQPAPFYAGQPNPLPLQVVNLGRRSAVLGNMKVTSTGGFVENGTLLIGSLEPGGYTTLDAMITPDMPGTVDIVVTIDYTDDFGTIRQVTKTLTMDVMEMAPMPTPDPNMPVDNGGIPSEETFLQKAWRFILGLFGLDSGVPQSPGGEPMPGDNGTPGGKPAPGPVIIGPKG